MSRLCPIKPLLRQLGDNAYRASPAFISGKSRDISSVASTLDEPFSGLLVDASHGHGKRGGQHKASCFISTKVDPGDDVDIVLGKAMASIPAHTKECILKARCTPAGEALFGIGRVAPRSARPRTHRRTAPHRYRRPTHPHLAELARIRVRQCKHQ
jgi:hypothetical protein